MRRGAVQKADSGMLGMKNKLAVVVIGRNEGERLARCLRSVAGATPWKEGVELIYVDSGSHDDSVRLAESLGWRVLPLEASRMTAALARNAGWTSSDSDWVLFLDGDTVLHSGFLAAALAAAESDPYIAAVWGHRREARPTANIFHRVLDLDWVYAPGMSAFCGGDALFRRSALQRVHGFDASLIAGEEPELCSRLRAVGYTILHIDHPMTVHDLAISRWSQYWKRASRAGYAYAQMAWRTRDRQMRLWVNESRGNAIRALALSALLALPWLHWSLGLASVIAFAMLCLRSAVRSSWKTDDRFSLFLYGIHSHVQQLPILAGQCAYFWDLMRSRRRTLIEYK